MVEFTKEELLFILIHLDNPRYLTIHEHPLYQSIKTKIEAELNNKKER